MRPLPARRPIATLLFAVALAMPLNAQSRSRPTLTIGITGGWLLGSGDLWRVPSQQVLSPAQIIDPPGTTFYDTFALSRNLSGDVTVGFNITRALSEAFSGTLDIGYAGLKTTDECTVLTTRDAENTALCKALNRTYRKSSAVTFMPGVAFYPMSRDKFQPYFLAKAGLAIVADKLLALGTTTSVGGTLEQHDIYPSDGKSRIGLTHTVGVGFTTNFAKGFQFRLEARENWLTVSRITGASASDGIAPPSETTYRRMASLVAGFDLVLAKSVGRRY